MIIKNFDCGRERNNFETSGDATRNQPLIRKLSQKSFKISETRQVIEKVSGLSFFCSTLTSIHSFAPLLLRTSSRRFLCKGKNKNAIVRKKSFLSAEYETFVLIDNEIFNVSNSALRNCAKRNSKRSVYSLQRCRKCSCKKCAIRYSLQLYRKCQCRKCSAKVIRK